MGDSDFEDFNIVDEDPPEEQEALRQMELEIMQMKAIKSAKDIPKPIEEVNDEIVKESVAQDGENGEGLDPEKTNGLEEEKDGDVKNDTEVQDTDMSEQPEIIRGENENEITRVESKEIQLTEPENEVSEEVAEVEEVVEEVVGRP